jgi:hypothetical protein
MQIAGKQPLSTKDASIGDMENGILTSKSRVGAVDSAGSQAIGPAIPDTAHEQCSSR